MFVDGMMDTPVVDLGATNKLFAGVLVPKGEQTTISLGVTRQFLEDANTYHERYFDISYATYLVKGALDAIKIDGQVDRILDIGSGSGPSVFALIGEFPMAHIVATDASPQLLAILRTALKEKDKSGQCTTICLDLNRPWFKKETFDLALGSAILHHLFEPERLITEIFAAVRPGGAVVFFEPFEPGYAVMAIIYRLILANASFTNSLDGRIADFLRGKIGETALMKCEPKDPAVYDTIDDKWMFTRDHVEAIGRSIGASKAIVYPINQSANPFTNHMRVMLRLGLGLDVSAMLPWAWEIISEIEANLSESCKREIFLEGCIAFIR